jgi:uncharacterized protein YndB with AHSA1/START domain
MTSAVLVSLRVAASPERAFDVFTQEIGQWWRPNGLFQITPRGDGVLSFEGGAGGRLIATLPNGVVYEIGRITTWAPGETLAFSWRPASVPEDLTTHVAVRFEAIGAETRVTVEHRGWSEIPQKHVARHGFPERATLMRASEWWRANLAALAAHAKAPDEG